MKYLTELPCKAGRNSLGKDTGASPESSNYPFFLLAFGAHYFTRFDEGEINHLPFSSACIISLQLINVTLSHEGKPEENCIVQNWSTEIA